MVTEAKQQIRQNYGQEFLIIGKEEYVTSLPEISIEEQQYRNELNDSIITRLKYINIDKSKRQKQKSYAEAVNGSQGSSSSENENTSRESKEDIESLSNPSELSKGSIDIASSNNQSTI